MLPRGDYRPRISPKWFRASPPRDTDMPFAAPRHDSRKRHAAAARRAFPCSPERGSRESFARRQKISRRKSRRHVAHDIIIRYDAADDMMSLRYIYYYRYMPC